MTKKQQEFYRILVNQMIDFNEDFYKEFTIKRIEQIEDDKLKYLLEDINTDKDNITNKKGYITYTKFIHYADKMIEQKTNLALLPQKNKIEELFAKRELLIHTIQTQTKSLQERNDLIEKLQNKQVMFQEDGKNILDESDYFIINEFGFYSFFDENRNYKIKEEIERCFKLYLTQKMNENKNIKKLSNN